MDDNENGKYYPQTWLFYGASVDNPSDAFVTWKARLIQRPVPVTAIRTISPRIRDVLATDVDHEGAYAVDPVDRSRSIYSDLSDALMFTVRSVVKIVQQVPAP